jgi:hypothetical protein
VLVGLAAAALLLRPPTPHWLDASLSIPLWLLLMVAPGACLFRWLQPERESLLAWLLAGVVASPVLVSILAAATLLAGGGARAAVATAAAASAIALVATGFDRRPPLEPPALREALWLALFALALVVLTAALPFTREWWQIRSDAWFHAAVVAQIRDFGLPPEDPYFVGLPLQYMWFYHVLVLTLATALRADPFWVMAAINVHALVALVLSGHRLAGAIRAGLLHRALATATLLLAFNGAFWVFLPLKLIKVFVGDVRGMEEIARTYTLTPVHYETALAFMNIYFNQEFFLDKFMVATAFGLALAFMTCAWAAAVDYLQTGRRNALALLAAAVVGMLGFHSLVGFVFLAGLVGGVAWLHVARRRAHGYRPRWAATAVAVSVLCFLFMTPYLYQVMHAKERAQVFPLDFSHRKIAGILISSAFVLVWAARARAFWSDRSPGARFLAYSAVVVTAFCFSISLPGPNTYDKLGYFVFIPFAVIAGFAIADALERKAGRARVRTAAWALLFFAPVNAIAFALCFGTPDAEEVTPAETRLSEWVRAHTPREAVFVDDDDRVPLLVTGPRRYFWGRLAYAEQWGYPRAEMSRRRHVVDAVYDASDLDGAALAGLASVEEPLYVVVRPQHAHSAVARHPELFEKVYDGGDIGLVRVDRDACAAASESAGWR